MRKTLSFLFALFLSASAFAQVEVGVNAGASFSSTDANAGNYSYGTLSGFYPEIYGGFVVADFLHLDLGMAYTTEGFTAQPQGESKRDVRLHYFSFPLTATARYALKNNWLVDVTAGLRFNFFNSSSAFYPFNRDFQQMNTTVGAIVGASVGYQLSSALSLSLRYRYSPMFSDVEDEGYLGKLSSHSILLNLNYLIDDYQLVGQEEDSQNMIW